MAFLSKLQKHIIGQCYQKRGRFSRQKLNEFYENKKNIPSKKEQNKIIGKSIDRLIHRGFLVGFGEKTAVKWLVKEIRLTTKGKKEAKILLGVQMTLDLK